MPHVDVPGARLYYETDGHASQPVLLLIHAGIATLRMWDPIVGSLSASHYVIRFDCRGFGNTTSEDVEFSNRDDARSILSHLGVERATIIGASRGGQIAIDIALETPDTVAGLVSIGSGPSGFPEVELTDAEEEIFERLDEHWENQDWPALVEDEVRLWAIGPSRTVGDVDEEFAATARHLGRLNLPRMAEKPVPRPLEPPAYERIDDIAAPALVVVGEFDVTPALVQFEYLAETIPDAASCHLQNTAHLPSVERPGAFLACLEPWLAKHGL